MKLNLIKRENFDLWSLSIGSKSTLSIYFYALKYSPCKLFDFLFHSERGVQIIELNLPLIYIQLITHIPLVWMSNPMDYAMDVLKERANNLEDNFAEFLLGDSNKINYDEQVELSILYQVINFYGSNNNDERGTGR